jgi:hypothetical protein
MSERENGMELSTDGECYENGADHWRMVREVVAVYRRLSREVEAVYGVPRIPYLSRSLKHAPHLTLAFLNLINTTTSI